MLLSAVLNCLVHCVIIEVPSRAFTACHWRALCSQARNTQQATTLQEKDAEINRLQRELRVRDRATVLQ